MSSKGGLQRASDLARHIQAIRKIIMAAIKGGWAGAAVEAVKHYWPYILPIAIALLLLPIIIFVSIPSMLFGFGDSEMAVTASAVRVQYDGYERYCNEYLSELYDKITQPAESQEETCEWETKLLNFRMEKEWFIAFQSVETGNDPEKITEEFIRAQIPKIITYEVKGKETSSSSDTASLSTAHEPKQSGKPVKVLLVRYLTPKEYMEQEGYSEADRNWAELMHSTLKEQEKASSELK